MGRIRTTWGHRLALRRLERQLRVQDPELATLLSGRGRSLLPPLRFTTLPTQGYVLVGVTLLVFGFYLSVGSAIFWGVVALLAAAIRHQVRPGDGSFTAPSRAEPDRRGYRET